MLDGRPTRPHGLASLSGELSGHHIRGTGDERNRARRPCRLLSWIVKANTGPDGDTILKPGKETLIGDEVMRRCDDLDGAEDGLISDPRKCEPDLSSLLCEEGADGKQCLSQAEIDVVTKWYQPARNAAGDELFPGRIPPGSEPFWWLWLTGKDDGTAPLNPEFGQSFGAYLAFDHDPGPDWSPVDFEKHPARMTRAAENYNSEFRDAGRKMIVWHGWADAIVLPQQTIKWYEEVKAKAGGEEALNENVKLFMIPGMDHCGILPGPGGIAMESIDQLTALEDWMETDEAPDSILAEK